MATNKNKVKGVQMDKGMIEDIVFATMLREFKDTSEYVRHLIEKDLSELKGNTDKSLSEIVREKLKQQRI
ncbi:MAG: hypothetical protein BWK75_04480 [Candidatus Altiarchaeales archaeon A3]|nr:MAG: hypothetical protein BWK75_04480 [Candidatus Altiarchaeales archaeon A3]